MRRPAERCVYLYPSKNSEAPLIIGQVHRSRRLGKSEGGPCQAYLASSPLMIGCRESGSHRLNVAPSCRSSANDGWSRPAGFSIIRDLENLYQSTAIVIVGLVDL